MANSVIVNLTVLINELHKFTRSHARAVSDVPPLSSVHLALLLVPLALLNTSPLDNGTASLTGLTSSYGLHI